MGVKDEFYCTEVILCFICPVGYITFSKRVILFSPGHVLYTEWIKRLLTRK